MAGHSKTGKSGSARFVWDPGTVNPKQKQFLESRSLYTCYGGAKGGGKALENGTLVCTPTGWKAVEQLVVGDEVIGSGGNPVKVLGVYPQGIKKIYTVSFRDGASIRVSGDHLWRYRVTGKPHKVKGVRYTRDNWTVGTTLEMLAAMHKCRSNQSVVIPLCGAVQWEKKELPIKPYTVGALLGDGSLTGQGVIITSADTEVIERIRADGYTVHKWRGDYDYGVLGIRKELNGIGLKHDSHNKRIPEEYLHSDIEDRLELLRGLMDTDGYCDKRGHCSYCSVSEGLARDVQYLVRSLGGMATLTKKNRASGVSYEVTIRMPDESGRIFHLSRKLARLKVYNGGISDVTRRVVAIEESGEGECTCIRVDSHDRLFVAENFIVTHNTHILRIKAIGGALTNPGIKILIMRKTYKDLERNHITPMLSIVPRGLYSYNNTGHVMKFENGSSIEFGHWQGEASEQEYNGIEYDWIFIDEATQFSERAYQFLGGCLRGANDIPKRMYLTCNPGGVGHRWVKRLFIDRDYKTDAADPDENENPDDYTFIFATVEDNTHLLNSPGGANYKHMLATMPENLKRAYRYGDWSAIGGNYFPEFSVNTHVVKPFKIPSHWTRYRAFDYGLDRLACYWIAVDEDGRSWVYREIEREGLIVKEAAEQILNNTLPDENITTTYAPPDMWSRQKDTGKTMAELYMRYEVPIIKSENNRVQGHMMIKDMLSPMPLHDPEVKEMYGAGAPTTLPGLMFFDNCKGIIKDIQDIQADETNPNDCATQPHEITHTVDGIRYYCVSRTLRAERPVLGLDDIDPDELDTESDYESFMCGGDADASYLSFGGI